MNSEVSDFIQTYKDVALNRSPVSAVLQPLPNNIINIHSSWAIQDLIRSESTKFGQEYLLQCHSGKCTLLSQGKPYDISSMSKCDFTKSGDKYAALQKIHKKDECVFLEIWNSTQKESTFDMSDRKEHGKICGDGLFQTFQWSANEKYILYIAEQKQKKSESYFKDIFCQKTEQKPDSDSDSEQKPDDEIVKGEECLYKESWGETYVNVHHTVLCMFEVKTGTVEVLNLDDTYPNISVAEATWGPNDEYIIFVGYHESPNRLGLAYCSNRRSSIFCYNLASKVVDCLVSEENICVDYPVFCPNFEKFVFLQNHTSGPHKSCRKLMKYDWQKKEVSTVIDIVEDISDNEFAGIYITMLSSRWWSDDRFFFFHTFRRSFLEIFCVDVDSSKLFRIDVDKSYGSCALFDVKDPYILVCVSSPSMLPCLMIGYFSNTEDRSKVIWSSVHENSCNKLQDISWDVQKLNPSLINKAYPCLNYDILTISSNVKKNGTLIIFPHGGPHSVFYATFYEYATAFARLGYIICMVNYRGSIGFGENSVKSLPGNVGSQDVSDVIKAIEFLKKDEKLGIQHVVGFGGSHGGFLIAHLLGQFPDLLKAACIRNPVIDLTSMVGISDIPDWCWIESGCKELYDPVENLNPSHLKEMWEKSPIKYIKNVKSPTLLCLGKKDLRVPSSQGFQFYKYLKAKNIPVKVYNYDDNHALSKVAVTSDAFVHIASWFQTYTSV